MEISRFLIILIGTDGKLYSGTALYTESGRLCALAHCTWIVLKE